MPAYIYVDRFALNVSPTQGTASNDISDAWVYVNDQAVGVYELPATIPVLYSGNQTITVAAGIKNDGRNESRSKYPFFENFVTTAINLTPGKVDSLIGLLKPTTTYKPLSDIDIWNENFDDAVIDFVAATNSDAGITFVNDTNLVYEGTGCGKIELTSGKIFAEVITSQIFTLPKLGKAVYVEINYNTNNSMAIGFLAINGTEITDLSNTILKPTNGVWKKMYVNCTDLVSRQSTATQFKFKIQVNKDTDITTVENYFDNFKVVYDK